MDDTNGDTLCDFIHTGSTQNVWVWDAYLASVTGTGWENVPGRAYRRKLVFWSKFAMPTGNGKFKPEVWRLNAPISQCSSQNTESIATLVETWEGIVQNSTGWYDAGFSVAGPGDNPTSSYGTVLRLKGENWGDGGDLSVAEFRVLYQHQ